MAADQEQTPETRMQEIRRKIAADLAYRQDDEQASREDWRFYASDQWREDDKARREDEGRPCVTMNQIDPKVSQIMNSIRAHKPQAQVIATMDAEEADAEIVEGLLRNVQTGKYADLAHDWATECAIVGGHGSWRIITQYANDRTMHQEICVEPIDDPFSVVWDANAKLPDKSDAMHCAVLQRMSRDEFKREFPKAKAVSASDLAALGEDNTQWISDEFILVADWFEVALEKATLIQLPTGETLLDDELPEDVTVSAYNADEGTCLVDGVECPCRQVDKRRVTWEKINGVETLDTYEWRGKWIPVITVTGKKVVIDGKVHIYGFVRNLKEPQRAYNWMTSSVYESIGVATKTPWIAPEGMIENHEQEWRRANRENRAVLQYKLLYDASGNVIPLKPERNNAEPPIQAVTEARIQADQDLKSISGMFDPAMGNAVLDQSGKAIQSLQQQSNLGTFNFGDNLVFALEHEARIIIDLLPIYNDTARTVEIATRAKSKKRVQIHNSQVEPTPAPDPTAEALLDLARGQYEPRVTVGPSFETQRQKDLEFWLRLAEGDPTTMQIGRDIIYDLVDSPESKAMAERGKAVLPPPVLNVVNGGQPDPAQLAAAVQQLQQQNQQLMSHNQLLMQEIQTKAVENAGKIQVEKIKSGTQLAVASSRVEVEKLKAQAQVLTRAADQHVTIVHDHALAHRQESHEQAMADKQRQAPPLNAQQAHAIDEALATQEA